ncbi:unnamed protein product [Chrysodeixis includens]|uniref:Uncharacterized protein n=1 Tax=Chrysodeixis includens TaxID=689277 RepID=A0A9N8L281_CHRIL|nr:unnamed protein product [Chrysodeixis includens]
MDSCNRNVTLRKRLAETGSASSFYEDTLNTSTGLNYSDSARSLPDLSKALLNCEVDELQSEVIKLRSELEQSQGEVDSLNMENDSLSKIIASQQTKIDQLKLLCMATSGSKKSSKRKRKSHKTRSHNNIASTQSKSNLDDSYNDLNIDEGNIDIKSPIKDQDTSHQNQSTVAAVSCSSSIELENKNADKRKRILIFTDNYGSLVRKYLQETAGSSYFVSCISKPGATSDRLLESCVEICNDFNNNDFVVIMCGNNDRNPLHTQSILYYYLNKLSHTNVFLCNVQRNRYLNESKLNDLMNHLCSQFNNCTFIYIESKMTFRNYNLIISRYIMRDILHIYYRYEYQQYKISQVSNTILNDVTTFISISTQTDKLINSNVISIGTQTENINDFFRGEQFNHYNAQ